MIKRVYSEQKNILSQIVKLEADAFGEGGLNEWNLMPMVRHGRVFYLDENDEVLGCVQYVLDWDEHTKAYLWGVSVSGRQRGKGLGTKLISESLQVLHGEGIKSVELTVDEDNKAAVEVYGRKLGFEIVGRRENEYGEGIHRIVMEKKYQK